METLGENLNMAWSSDGKTIVIGNRNDKVVWVDVEEQKITRRIDMGKDVSSSLLRRNCPRATGLVPSGSMH